MNTQICVIIPTLNPDDKLIPYIEDLLQNGVSRILLINDGSRAELAPVFSALAAKEEVTLLTHAVNMGKGRALKDAFNYYLVHLADSYDGVITVDSDGQHTVADVLRVHEMMQAHPEALVLGCRNFNDSSVPPKSKFGNKLTRIVLKVLIGGDITDTQTGLRGIPNALLGPYSVLPGERFEYETNMLIDAIKGSTPIREVEIETIYINDNRETHFNPLKDSIAIYSLILGTFVKYLGASLASFLLDYGLFCLLIALLPIAVDTTKIWTATIIARICSSLFNYTVNKNVVFKSTAGRKTLVQYYILAVCQMLCSAALVAFLNHNFQMVAQAGKLIVDTVLFLLSFQIQNRIIFKR